MDLQDFARIGANFFTSAKYENGDTFIKLKDDAPNWIKDAVYVAHDDMMPDDRIYDVACQAFHFIAESDDDEPDSGEFANSTVDVYTGQLTAWMASHLARVSLVDEARDEFGDGEDIASMIAMGQYLESTRVFHAILEACRGEVE